MKLLIFLMMIITVLSMQRPFTEQGLLKAAFETLGLSFRDANSYNAKDIKSAYWEKAKERHPDKNPNDPKATENFQALNAAHEQVSAWIRAKPKVKGVYPKQYQKQYQNTKHSKYHQYGQRQKYKDPRYHQHKDQDEDQDVYEKFLKAYEEILEQYSLDIAEFYEKNNGQYGEMEHLKIIIYIEQTRLYKLYQSNEVLVKELSLIFKLKIKEINKYLQFNMTKKENPNNVVTREDFRKYGAEYDYFFLPKYKAIQKAHTKDGRIIKKLVQELELYKEFKHNIIVYKFLTYNRIKARVNELKGYIRIPN
jgi:curved DNA-binding protein CbpA